MKGIIPTGGRGTRMQPITFSANKHFIPVANKPLIYYPVETLVKAGIQEIGITYNPGGLEAAKDFLGDGSQWGIKITYILQEKAAGLANIIQVSKDFLNGESFVFHLGDNILVDGIDNQVKRFAGGKSNALVLYIKHKDNTRLGVPQFDKSGKFIKYLEKPKNPPNQFGIPGVYFFDSNVFKCFEGKDKIKASERGEFEISAPYNWLVDHQYLVDSFEYKGKWLDPGKFDDWIDANQFLLDNTLQTNLESEVDKNSSVQNRVSIGKDCQIINSKIRGPVSIEDGVLIKDSYIGPYTSISKNVVVDGSHVENSVLMEGVKILNVDRPIDSSLIGAETVITKDGSPTRTIKFFVGNKCQVEI